MSTGPGCRAVLVLLSAVLLFGCASDELTGTVVSNVPPQVWLTAAPPEGSTVHYSVHMHWGGFDPDGTISHYEYIITNNESGVFEPADTAGVDKWLPTYAGDSVFVVTADQVADSALIDFEEMAPYEFTRSHTFFVRAVDDEGARSKAAYRSFTARNLSPTVTILLPRTTGFNIALVPPQVSVHWSASDPVGTEQDQQKPDSIRSIVVSAGVHGGNKEALAYIRAHPNAPEWTEWRSFAAPGDSGTFWRPAQPMSFGAYVFAVQAKDEAGAVNPVFDVDRNVRFFQVLQRLTGPVLILTNEYLGRVITSAKTTPPTVLNVPAGLPIELSWSADASSYGGVVTGYRYGWDIIDVSKDEEWEIDYTPFVGNKAQAPVRTWFFGTHTFNLEVRDNSGIQSGIPIIVNVVPVTMDRPVLVVDDWNEGIGPSFATTLGAVPSDREHDAFWADMMRDVADFSPGADMIPFQGTLSNVALGTLTRYKTVIWNARAEPALNRAYGSVLDEMIRFNSPTPNLLRMYLKIGGKVMICGDHAMTMTIDKLVFPDLPPWFTGPGPGYPVILRYELGGEQFGDWEDQEIGVRGIGEHSFAYDDCCLNVIDMAWGIDFSKQRRFCVVTGARRFDPEDEGLRAAVPMDSQFPFPRLELRPEVSSPGKFYDKLGLESDLFNPPYFEAICDFAETARACFQPMYGLECHNPSSGAFGAPVAYWNSRFADRVSPGGPPARSVVWGFSPVFFKPDQVREALNIILFDEWQLERKNPAPANAER